MPADSSKKRTSEKSSGDRRRFGPYEIQRPLGRGGMGAVYLAVDTSLDRQVALKVLRREKSLDPTAVKRFREEARAAAQLQHPNIVGIYGTGEIDRQLYIALEYVSGSDVMAFVKKRGPVAPRRSLHIIKQVVHALEHAFDQGIVHRDIKPSNLLLQPDGKVKLADLGLARSLDREMTAITQEGNTVGTVDYMSPEQARNSQLADTRSDIYSLGCTWFHLLTGRPPYVTDSVPTTIYAHAKLPIPNPRELNSEIPESMAAVLRQMMAKDPEERPSTPAVLRSELDRAKHRSWSVPSNALEALADESTQRISAMRTPPAAGIPAYDEAEPSNSGSSRSVQLSSGWLVALVIAPLLLVAFWIGMNQSTAPPAPVDTDDNPFANRRQAAAKPPVFGDGDDASSSASQPENGNDPMDDGDDSESTDRKPDDTPTDDPEDGRRPATVGTPRKGEPDF